MHFLLIKRVDTFGDNASNRWSVSGPFQAHIDAANAALQALGTNTCVAAQILTKEQIVALSNAHSNDQSDHYLQKAVQAAKYLYASS